MKTRSAALALTLSLALGLAVPAQARTADYPALQAEKLALQAKNPFMRLAIAEALEGIRQGHGGPFGCVVVKDGKVIAQGHNKVLKMRNPILHGEIDAIEASCRRLGTHDLSGCEIYTTGEPCPMCLGAILWANIGKVYYGCNVIDTDKIGFRDDVFYQRFSAREGFCEQLDRDECLKLYGEYVAIADKQNY